MGKPFDMLQTVRRILLGVNHAVMTLPVPEKADQKRAWSSLLDAKAMAEAIIEGTPPGDEQTLRDYFAAQALSGLFAANAFDRADRRHESMAAQAYKFADAMLSERAK